MSKTARHKAILDVLDDGPVESQDSLQHRLERKGFDVGQATLSRDIHELKLVKGPEGYRRAGESLGADSVLPSVMHLARQFVVEIRQAQNLLVVADLTMDEEAREVRRGGELVDLTATEFELLRFLMRNPRRVLSKALILDRVWNYDFGGQAHVVELYISYLRKKIDANREPLIHTVRGVGYVLKPAN